MTGQMRWWPAVTVQTIRETWPTAQHRKIELGVVINFLSVFVVAMVFKCIHCECDCHVQLAGSEAGRPRPGQRAAICESLAFDQTAAGMEEKHNTHSASTGPLKQYANVITPLSNGVTLDLRYNNNKHLRCGNRKGLLGRNDQTHHRMDPNTMASRLPTKQY